MAVNWQDTGPHAPSVQLCQALGQGCRQSCWPARPQLSQGLVLMPVDSPQIFATGSASLPLAPASNSTHHKQVPHQPQHRPHLSDTPPRANQDKNPESPSTVPFTQASRPVPLRSILLDCPLLSTLPPTPRPTPLQQPPGPCSSLLIGSLLPFLPHNLKNHKPDPTTLLVPLSQDKVWADSMARLAPARLSDQPQGSLPQ